MTDVYTALAAAQAEFPGLVKSANNPFYKSKYTPLEDVLAAVAPVLQKHGLLVLQIPAVIGTFQPPAAIGTETLAPSLRTEIRHLESETSIVGDLLLQATAQDPQKQGAALTYARRYAIVCMLGLATEIDDDGNTASGQVVPPKTDTQSSRSSRSAGNTSPTRDTLTIGPPVESFSDAPFDDGLGPNVGVEPFVPLPNSPVHKSRKPTKKQTAIQIRNQEWADLNNGIADEVAKTAGRPTPSQNNMFWALLRGKAYEPHAFASEALGRTVESITHVTGEEMTQLIKILKAGADVDS